jgi:aminoglycoside phosphotransferase (APT) family kinase protein
MEPKEKHFSPEGQNKGHVDQVSFMHAKHEQMNTPDSIIENAVEKATGLHLSSKQRIIDGESNEVYSVTTEDGSDLIIRISHSEKDKFEKERWALEHCAEAGVSVPKVIFLESKKLENKTLQMCVETKLSGIGLNKVPDILSPEKQAKLANLLGQVGENLAKVHLVKTNGFGRLDKNGNAKFTSVHELVTGDKYIYNNDILEAVKDTQGASHTILKAYEILKKESESYADTFSCLVHNDLSPQHILIDGEKVSGLIDFESACGGDPLIDLALWDSKFGEKYPLKYILEGYTKLNPEVASDDFQRRLNFWKIYRALGSLSYCVREGKKFRVDRLIEVITEMVKYFDY